MGGDLRPTASARATHTRHTMDNVGGSMYWATTAELQSSIPGVPDEYASGNGVHRCRQRLSLQRATTFGSSHSRSPTTTVVRSSVGAGLTGPRRSCVTVDYAVPLTKAAYDVVQPLRFSAGGF